MSLCVRHLPMVKPAKPASATVVGGIEMTVIMRSIVLWQCSKI